MSAIDFSGAVPRDVTEGARLRGPQFERKVAGVLARARSGAAGRKGDVGVSDPGAVRDVERELADHLSETRLCVRCRQTSFYRGRETKGSLGCPVLNGDAQDSEKGPCLRLELQNAALEVRDPLLVRLWHALSVSWRETKTRVGEALQ